MLPPLPPAQPFAHIAGNCTISGNCIQSPNYPSDYGTLERCVVLNLPAVPAVVVRFNIYRNIRADKCNRGSFLELNG
eukprot:1707503-Prymnesium_polylepis.1